MSQPKRKRPKPKAPQDYESLKKLWYQKLKDEGFKDAELPNGTLAQWSNLLVKTHSLEQMQAKQSYFQMADRFLGEYPFETPLDQIVWEYHSNGLSVREISQVLDKVTEKPHSKDTVHRLIMSLEDKMLRMYSTLGSDDEH
jgi:hypothetical protein